jgi:hypothetical protein
MNTEGFTIITVDSLATDMTYTLDTIRLMEGIPDNYGARKAAMESQLSTVDHPSALLRSVKMYDMIDTKSTTRISDLKYPY